MKDQIPNDNGELRSQEADELLARFGIERTGFEFDFIPARIHFEGAVRANAFGVMIPHELESPTLQAIEAYSLRAWLVIQCQTCSFRLSDK